MADQVVPALNLQMVTSYGGVIPAPLNDLPLNNILGQMRSSSQPNNLPVGLDALKGADSGGIFRDMKVTAGDSNFFGTVQGVDLSSNYAINTKAINLPDFGQVTIGDLILVRKSIGETEVKIGLDKSRAQMPIQSRVLDVGKESYILTPERLMVITPHAFNAIMASMSEQNLINPETGKEFTVEELWNRWAIYGVVSGTNVPPVGTYGAERPSNPLTLTGREKSLTVTYRGQCDMRNYFSTLLAPFQRVFMILKRSPGYLRYNISGASDRFYDPGHDVTNSPFALSFYANPDGKDWPPPEHLTKYVDSQGRVRRGLVFSLGRVLYSYPNQMKFPTYTPNDVIDTYNSGKVRLELAQRPFYE